MNHSDDNDMYNQLQFLSIPSSDVVGGQEFIPLDKIAPFLTEANVQATLGDAGLASQGLIEFVLQKANKVFLILVCTAKVEALGDLYSAGFDDGSLPVGKEQATNALLSTAQAFRYRLASMNKTTHKLETYWPVFDAWSPRDIREFERNQWHFLAPTFAEDTFFYTFHRMCPVPLLSLRAASEDGEDEPCGSGNFSTVYKLGVYNDKACIALKVFREDLKLYFRRELDTLRKIRAISHPHLIRPIAAFEKGSKRCFVFPWADGGNLLEFWRDTDEMCSQRPFPTPLIFWALEQMQGLADCLVTLHEENCRHGDLKPGNILHFKDSGDRGRLVIADFGLAKFHILDTRRRIGKSSMFDRTLRYEPPEMEEEFKSDGPRSRSYDIWSTGCIFLEFSIWLIYGWSYLEGFIRANINEMFWELNGKNYQVHHKVQDEIAKILGHLKADAAVKDIVTLVRDRFLVIKPHKSAENLQECRATALELRDSMNKLIRRASGEQSYLQGTAIPLRTNMGDTLTVRDTSAVSAVSKQLLPVNDEFTPQIIVRAPTNDFGQNQSTSSPRITPSVAVSPEIQIADMDHKWEAAPDNDFARKVFEQVDYAGRQPATDYSSLCYSCTSIDFTSKVLEIDYNREELSKRASYCEFCRMCEQGLLEAGLGDASGKLVRAASTLKAGHQGPPIISIYGDPAGHQPQAFAQLGFPVLPEVASAEQFEVLRQWIQLCDGDHECYPWRSSDEPPEMPTRVIDIGMSATDKLRLVRTGAHIRARYTALSHCWGNITESEKFRAKKGNMAEISREINHNRLPRTFRHAIKVTRELGVRYLWIDSICIIQDDPEDWATESHKMETVFSSAYCTIAASSARSSVDGFLKKGRVPRSCVIHRSPAAGTLFLAPSIDDFQKDVEESILNTRGWVFQERALSRRTIFFTSNQVYWECGHGVRCETLSTLRNSVAAFLGDSDFPTSALPYFKGARIILFHQLYQMYSKLAFTVPTDRSVALIGLEKRLSRTFDTRVEYGIVEKYMERDLLWRRDRKGDMLTRIDYPSARRVPSWSWMAYSGEIEYLPVPFDETEWCRENINRPLDGGSMRQAEASGGAELRVAVNSMTMSGIDVRARIFRDNEDDKVDEPSLGCVIIGRGKAGRETEDGQIHYVLVVRPLGTANHYERVGVGCLFARHIREQPRRWVTLR